MYVDCLECFEFLSWFSVLLIEREMKRNKTKKKLIGLDGVDEGEVRVSRVLGLL